jgi:serine protease inhibitor
MKKAALATTLLIGSLSLLPENVKANPFAELALIGKNCMRLSPRPMAPTFIRRDPFLRSNYLKSYRSYSSVKGNEFNELVKDPTVQTSKVSTSSESETLGNKFLRKVSFTQLKKSVVDYVMSFRSGSQPIDGMAGASNIEPNSIKRSTFDEDGVETYDAHAALYLTGAKLHAIIQKEQPTNNVYCPMGATQTLALLSAIAEESIQGEITQFSQNPKIVEDMTALNELIQASTNSYTPMNKWDNRRFDFTNGVYALLASHLNLNKDRVAPLAAIGARITETDFSDSAEAASKINAIVEKDTKGKIKDLFPAAAFSQDSVFVLLHTLYVNASWIWGNVEKSHFKFSDLNKKGKYVKSLALSGTSLQFTQNDGVTLVTLPTVGGCNLTLRHSHNVRDIRPIEAAEISYLRNSTPQYTQIFNAPFVSMKQSLDLKTLLGGCLPRVLRGSFNTALTDRPIKIADYIQKVTFEMSDKGVEASAATALHGVKESACMYRNGPIININSPFSFTLTRSLGGKDYLLFQGQVVNHDVLVRN